MSWVIPPTGFAARADIQANHALAFNPDHSLGADQLFRGIILGYGCLCTGRSRQRVQPNPEL